MKRQGDGKSRGYAISLPIFLFDCLAPIWAGIPNVTILGHVAAPMSAFLLGIPSPPLIIFVLPDPNKLFTAFGFPVSAQRHQLFSISRLSEHWHFYYIIRHFNLFSSSSSADVRTETSPEHGSLASAGKNPAFANFLLIFLCTNISYNQCSLAGPLAYHLSAWERMPQVHATQQMLDVYPSLAQRLPPSILDNLLLYLECMDTHRFAVGSVVSLTVRIE